MAISVRDAAMGCIELEATAGMTGLDKANHVRQTWPRIKRCVNVGSVDICDLLVNPPWELANMPIDILLASQRRWGNDRSRRLLKQLRITENTQVGKLEATECSRLVSRLRNTK